MPDVSEETRSLVLCQTCSEEKNSSLDVPEKDNDACWSEEVVSRDEAATVMARTKLIMYQQRKKNGWSEITYLKQMTKYL